MLNKIMTCKRAVQNWKQCGGTCCGVWHLVVT